MLNNFRYFIGDVIVNKIVTSATVNKVINHFVGLSIPLQMQKNALESTTKYVEENMIIAFNFPDQLSVIKSALLQANSEGLFMEFGVAGGYTMNFMAKLVKNTIHGFDSFEGLPEAWADMGKGHFHQKGKLPSVPNNVQLHVGWFDKSLPEFAASNKEDISFMHVDCDLYSSTKTILDVLGERIKSGTIIVFDEYFNYPGWQQHEYKAFQEFVAKNNIKYEYIGYNKYGWGVAVKIL